MAATVNYERILQSFKLEKSMLPTASRIEKETMIHRAIKAAERLKVSVPTPIDPSTLPIWDKQEHTYKSALVYLSLEELPVRDYMPKMLAGEPLFEARQTLVKIGDLLDKTPGGVFVLLDGDQLDALAIHPIEARKLSGGEICLVVAWAPISYGGNPISTNTRETVTVIQAIEQDTNPAMVFKSDIDEQYIVKTILESHQELLTPTYKQQLRSNMKYDLLKKWNISFFLPLGSLSSTALAKFAEVHACKQCGNVAKLRCSRCEIWYCSSGCQKQDWPLHKQECAIKSTGKAISCSFVSPAFLFTYNSRDSWSELHKRAHKTGNRADNDVWPNAHGKGRFLVKIQRPLDKLYGCMMVYDAKRSLQGMIIPAPEQSNRAGDDFYNNLVIHKENTAESIATIVKLIQQRGFKGLKAYFWAERESDWSLRIYVDDLPAQSDIKW